MIDARVPKTPPFCTNRHEPRCARTFSNEPRKREGTKVQWESWTSPGFCSSSSLGRLLSYYSSLSGFGTPAWPLPPKRSTVCFMHF
jgi:hypothetical protein